MPNQVPSSPHVPQPPQSQPTANSTQSLATSVQGITLNTPNLSTQAALDNAIASIMNSPTATSGVQVISSGISMPNQSTQQTSTTSALSNALLRSVTFVKKTIADNPLCEFPCILVIVNIESNERYFDFIPANFINVQEIYRRKKGELS